MTELFSDSEGKGAVGAFNVHCFEMVPAMVRAAEEMEMPIILQTSLGTAQYIGFGPLVAAIKALADKSSIDVALHMDHCKSVEALKKAIDCGYSSVMYDGSSLALEENIRNTQEVVDYAHERNVSVEGEVGSIGGAEEGVVVSKDEAMYTRPEDALYFAERTQVDALAVSIGTTHGQYKSKAKINYELLDDPDVNNNINDYYQSWVLRGNNPKFASDMEESDDELEQEWDNCAENHEYGIEIAKFNINALELFDQYHKDEIVERGSEAVAFTIKESYVEDFYKLLEAIQEQLLKEIESKRISIECNPTSNYKIGEMSNYDEHPILKFYNSGLNTPYNKHDIAVSINTDDQGVFSTSLEREYSLIALAIERHQTEGFKNSPRQIIDWLDKIRQMSVEQQFDNDIFNYKKN